LKLLASNFMLISQAPLPPDRIFGDESLERIEPGRVRSPLLQILKCIPQTNFVIVSAIVEMNEKPATAISPGCEKTVIEPSHPLVAVSIVEELIDRAVV
jgi:hypothetical protein